MCHRNLNIQYIFWRRLGLLVIEIIVTYIPLSTWGKCFSISSNMWISHMAAHPHNHLVSRTTVQLQDAQWEAPWRGRTQWTQPLPFTPEAQGTQEGGGTGWAAAPLAGAWRAEMGRAARVQRGRPRSVPHLSAVSVWTTPLRGAGDLRVRFGE